MWTRDLLKTNAKHALHGRYWRSFWICLVISLLSGSAVTIRNNISNISDAGDNWVYRYLYSLSYRELTRIMGILLLVYVVAIVWNLFVLSPLQVGLRRYFMESRQALSPASTVIGVFRTPYLNVVKVQFLTALKIVLGYFLLLVPGIYWSYCYVLVPYLLAENPYMTTGRAMELSKEMMDGEKWNYFVLQLSFIGWYLLCGLSLGVGSYFLMPYTQATYAEFYAAMRSKALARGMTTAQELGGFVTHGDTVL